MQSCVQNITTVVTYLIYTSHPIICKAHNIYQLAESEVRTVTGGTWQG